MVERRCVMGLPLGESGCFVVEERCGVGSTTGALMFMVEERCVVVAGGDSTTCPLIRMSEGGCVVVGLKRR